MFAATASKPPPRPLTDDVFLYASAKTGFKSGLLNPSNPIAGSVGLEENLAIEGGFKSEFAGDRVRLNGAFFFYDYDNIQVTVVDQTSGATQFIDGGPAEYYGGELELTALLADDLTFTTNATILDAEYTSDATQTNQFGTIVLPLTGNMPVGAADFAGSFGGAMACVSARLGSLKALFANKETAMTARTGKAIFLKAYPDGLPAPDLFEVRSVDIPAPQQGEVLLRTVWMSVDPYMRGRMNPHVKSYIPPFSLDAPLDGGAVSEVVASNAEGFAPGDYVAAFQGAWQEYHMATPDGLTKVDPGLAPLSAYLGVLGMPGLTAWAGLTQILKPEKGETLFVSGAAGAVGSLVCQLGAQAGMRVIGSAGSPEKCRWLEDEGGCDVALHYKEYKDAGALTKALAAAAPDGVNCYFENVGGDHLEAALNCMAFGGRIALCGMIAQYNNKAPAPGPANLINMVGRGLMAQGFIVSNYMHLAPQFAAEVAPLLAAGKVHFRESAYEGLDAAPEAFLGLFKGENFGKAVIRVGPDRI